MIKRVVIGSLVALTLVGAGIAIGAGADGNWGHGHDTVVVNGGGTGAGNAGETIVVSDGHYHGFFFFPFGLLFFVLILFFVFSLFRRGGRGGPWRYGAEGPAGLTTGTAGHTSATRRTRWIRDPGEAAASGGTARGLAAARRPWNPWPREHDSRRGRRARHRAAGGGLPRGCRLLGPARRDRR
jgi:hypothetical protein